jgi:hypothetical protein
VVGFTAGSREAAKKKSEVEQGGGREEEVAAAMMMTVSIVSRLRVGRSENRGAISGKKRDFTIHHHVQRNPWGPLIAS